MHSKMGYLSYTPFIPKYPFDNANTFSASRFLSYIRGVVTPEKVGNFDLAAGFQLWKGTAQVGPPDTRTPYHADAWAIDAQAQGKTGNLPLGVYLTYGSAAKSVDGSTANLFNSSIDANRKAWTIAAELGVVPSKLTLGAAYRNAHSGDTDGTDTDNAVTLAMTYNLVKNVAFQLNHSFYTYGTSPALADIRNLQGNQHTTLVMYSGF